MLRSRREFLERGYYEKFSDKLNAIVTGMLPSGKETEESVGILDAGCGEGYYIHRLRHHLSNSYRRMAIDYYGIDVSKPAIDYASGRDRDIRFAVASSYHIPVMKASVDSILCVFAPRDEQEFRRILKPAGKLVVAAPGARHLFSFRELVYDAPDAIGQKGTVGEGFRLVEQYNVNYDIHLETSQDIFNLFMMTPYSRHADAGAVDRLNEFSTAVDINILVYQKT